MGRAPSAVAAARAARTASRSVSSTLAGISTVGGEEEEGGDTGDGDGDDAGAGAGDEDDDDAGGGGDVPAGGVGAIARTPAARCR